MAVASCVNMLSVARTDTRRREKSAGKKVEVEKPPAPQGRSTITYVWTSVLLLVPCFWQSRLQAGDLSSHIYNAWLAQSIESGRASGLSIAFQTTNVLF